jgi:superfamily I DNA and/or RNA helicase
LFQQVEEAGLMHLIECLPAIVLQSKECVIAFFGDIKQLPPFDDSIVGMQYGTTMSLMELIKPYSSNSLLLNTNYRNNLEVKQFISNKYYEGQLVSGVSYLG